MNRPVGVYKIGVWSTVFAEAFVVFFECGVCLVEKVFGINFLKRFQLERETRALALIKVALGLGEGARITSYVVHLSSVGAFLSDSVLG